MMRYYYLVQLFLFIGYLTANGKARSIKLPSNDVGVFDLRCQYLKNQAGIDEKPPSFSWKLASADRNVKQTAYHILVASSEKNLEQGAYLWSSGKINSDQNTFVKYKGKSLHSAHKYYWKVKVYINKSKKDKWSEPTYFITGIFSQSHFISFISQIN